MSERKVLNKYYPPDFDPSKIPRRKGVAQNHKFTVRLMAPFSMKCKTCGEYIYKGRKFNARKEDVDGTYLGLRIYRFYIKCTSCLAEIVFKTDPQNTDYEIEAGATRNFMALKMAEDKARQEEEEEKEEEATNPMKLLERRTDQSRRELEILESLEELKDLNRRQQSVDYEDMLQKYDTTAARVRTEKEQEEIDEQIVQDIFKSKKKLTGKVVEEETVEIEEEAIVEPPSKVKKITDASSSFAKPVISLAEKRNKFGIKIKTGNNSATATEDTRKNPEVKEKSTSENTSVKSDKTDVGNSCVGGTNVSSGKPSGLSLLGAYSDSEEDSN